jgi:IS1 family transposase
MKGHIKLGMNKLDSTARAQIIHLLCEGMSLRAITRLTGASKTTVSKLAVDAGTAAAWYQDRVFQSLTCKRLQIDEIWGFVGAKQKNVANMKNVRGHAGDAWLWLATDADTKLVPCWHVGRRDGDAAMQFIDDLASRLGNRVQITTDGLKSYLYAIDAAFGGEVDYAMLVKLYGPSPEGQRRYSPAECVGAIKGVVSGNSDMSTSARPMPSATISMCACTLAA